MLFVMSRPSHEGLGTVGASVDIEELVLVDLSLFEDGSSCAELQRAGVDRDRDRRSPWLRDHNMTSALTHLRPAEPDKGSQHRVVLAFITEKKVIHAILEHLGVPTTGPPIAPARSTSPDEFTGWQDDVPELVVCYRICVEPSRDRVD